MGFKFETGATYSVEGQIAACHNGFHAIPGDQHPLSVFGYYPPGTSRYAEVIQSGETDRRDDKLASAKITIGVEISLGELAARAVKWVFDRANWKDGPHVTGANEAATASGSRGAATASGDRGAATASGYQGAATASGYRGAATASGDQGAATASGYQGAATASGDRGAATASGDRGAATASGKYCVATATGFEARAKANEGCAICLVHRNDETGEIIAIHASKVGENGIKPDVWYSLSADGRFIEADGWEDES